MSKRSRSNIIEFIISLSLIVVLALGGLMLFSKITEQEKTETLGNTAFTWSIGLINEDGEYEQGTVSMYTEKYYPTEGLDCDIEKNATIKYTLVFYDKDKNLVSIVNNLTEDFDVSSCPTNAAFFRVMITPTNDPEISIMEISTYAKQLSVSFDK